MRESLFGVFVVLFIAACGFQILKGTMPWRRAVICGMQCVCVVMIYVVAIPRTPDTDVGKFADAMTREYGEQFAVALAHKQQEKLNAIQYATDR